MISTGTGVVAVSHKAYFGAKQTVEWCRAVAEAVRSRPAVERGSVEVVVLPSAPMIPAAIEVFSGTGVRVGAQDLHWDSGAYTGQISAALLAELGCAVAEVGHAERRELGDTDDIVARKTSAAIAAGLTPLICVGENEPTSPDAAADECLRQFRGSVERASDRQGDVLVAYEPVWAIGADDPASPDYVNQVASRLLDNVLGLWSGQVRVMYGGTARPGLIERLGPAVAGLFLGRSAHDVSGLAMVLDETIARYASLSQRPSVQPHSNPTLGNRTISRGSL